MVRDRKFGHTPKKGTIIGTTAQTEKSLTNREVEGVVGKYGVPGENESGERLLDMCGARVGNWK